MNYFNILRKLCFAVFFGYTLFVYGQEYTISTKWPLCECVNGAGEEVQHDIIINDTEKYREFHTSIDHDDKVENFNVGTMQLGDKRKVVFKNYPRKKFEPFICQYDSFSNWRGFQFIDMWKEFSEKHTFVYDINCKDSNDICILMPFSHGCDKLPKGFEELSVGGLDELERLKDLDILEKLNHTKKAVINCNVVGRTLHLDIHIPKNCKAVDVDLSRSPLMMHLNKEYFSDNITRSIIIKKVAGNRVVITFSINNKQPSGIADISKSLLIWNNETVSYELTTKDLLDSNLKFTHTLPNITWKKKIRSVFVMFNNYLKGKGLDFSFDESKFECALLEQCSPYMRAMNNIPVVKALFYSIFLSLPGVTIQSDNALADVPIQSNKTCVSVATKSKGSVFYQIDSPAQFARLGHEYEKAKNNGVSFIACLANDISLSYDTFINKNVVFDVDFVDSIFNGNNYKIKGLTKTLFRSIGNNGIIHNLRIHEFAHDDSANATILALKLLPGSRIFNMEFDTVRMVNIHGRGSIIAQEFYGGYVKNICIKNILADLSYVDHVKVGSQEFGVLFGCCNVGSNEAILENIHLCKTQLRGRNMHSNIGFICGLEKYSSRDSESFGPGMVKNIKNLTIYNSQINTGNLYDFHSDIISGKMSSNILKGKFILRQNLIEYRNAYIKGLYLCNVDVRDKGGRIRYVNTNSCSKDIASDYNDCNTGCTLNSKVSSVTSAPAVSAKPRYPELMSYSKETLSSQKPYKTQLLSNNNSKLELDKVTIPTGGIGAAGLACALWTGYSYMKYYKNNYRGLSLLAAPLTNIQRVLYGNKLFSKHRVNDFSHMKFESIKVEGTGYNN